jgi:ketosteroid isomerase-like protein
MPSENLQIVELMYEAFKNGDLGTIMKYFASDLEIYQSEQLPWGGTYKGTMGAMSFFSKLRGSVDSAVETEQLIDSGEHVIQIGRTRGKAKKGDKTFDIPEVHVWKFRDGKIVGFHAFIDNPGMLSVLER